MTEVNQEDGKVVVYISSSDDEGDDTAAKITNEQYWKSRATELQKKADELQRTVAKMKQEVARWKTNAQKSEKQLAELQQLAKEQTVSKAESLCGTKRKAESASGIDSNSQRQRGCAVSSLYFSPSLLSPSVLCLKEGYAVLNLNVLENLPSGVLSVLKQRQFPFKIVQCQKGDGRKSTRPLATDTKLFRELEKVILKHFPEGWAISNVVLLKTGKEGCCAQDTHYDFAEGKGVGGVLLALGKSVRWGDGITGKEVKVPEGHMVVFKADYPHFGCGYQYSDESDDLRMHFYVHRSAELAKSEKEERIYSAVAGTETPYGFVKAR